MTSLLIAETEHERMRAAALRMQAHASDLEREGNRVDAAYWRTFAKEGERLAEQRRENMTGRADRRE